MSDEGENSRVQAFEARLAVLAEKVRAGFPERARELSAAVEALGLSEPAARQDIRRCAHKLRGTAGSHGFRHLSEVAARLEALALEGPRSEVIAAAHALTAALEAEAEARAPTPAPVDTESAPERAWSGPTLAGLRIAAVDDDGATCRLLRLTLATVGRAEVVVEERGAHLLERLRTEHFDVVIVDAMMPEMSGLACLERIVADALHREGTHYFVLSAASEQELAWSLPPELAVGWLRKPFRPRVLVDAIAAQLGR